MDETAVIKSSLSSTHQMSRLMANPEEFLRLGDKALLTAQALIDKRERLSMNGLGSVKKNVHLRIYGEIGLDREFFTGTCRHGTSSFPCFCSTHYPIQWSSNFDPLRYVNVSLPFALQFPNARNYTVWFDLRGLSFAQRFLVSFNTSKSSYAGSAISNSRQKSILS